MSTFLIAYASTHGHTAKIVARIVDVLRAAGHAADVCDDVASADPLPCEVRGPELLIGPVTDVVGWILLGEFLRDFGAAAARIHLEATGGSVRVDGDSLLVELPT